MYNEFDCAALIEGKLELKLKRMEGATTLCIMTFSLMTFSIMALSIMAQCSYAECHKLALNGEFLGAHGRCYDIQRNGIWQNANLQNDIP